MSQTPREKRIINIGIIGCGGISKNHLMSLALIIANANKIWKDSSHKVNPILYALADINPDAVNTMNSHFPAKKVYSGPNAGYDLINDPDIHAVFVLVPTKFHLEYVVAASAKGKHVFCEKPCAMTPDDVQKMIQAREKYKNIIQVGLVFRSAAQILYLKRLIHENSEKWGKLTNVIFRDSQEKPYKGALEVHNSTWRSDKNLAHGGILFEHTIHDIDGMILILGEIKEVFARINYYAGIEGIEDSVAAILTFKNGVNLTINSIWNDIDYSVRRFEIFFERAYIIVTVDERNQKSVEIRVKYLKDPEIILKDDEMDFYFRQFIDKTYIKPEITGPYYYEDLRFLDAIVNRTPADITLEQAYYVQNIIEACYESNRRKRIIKMDEFNSKKGIV